MAKKIITLFLVSIFLQYLYCNNNKIEAAPEEYLVKSLPGFKGTFPSKHYAGYLTLDGNPQKNLFYYFVSSENNPSQDPVVLWLNGGPGCSSFDGFVYEHGPFNFEAPKKQGGLPRLHLNHHSWSKVANIIYLDSPVGAGFSYYSPNSTYYQVGDIETASDSHLFLLKWFEQYPEFSTNPFYLSGESYAGVYIPTLASNIVEGIKSKVEPFINFKGYMIGNGVCDPTFDDNALVPFAHGMALISDNLYKEAETDCKGNYHSSDDLKCREMLSKIDSVLYELNIYDILEPCYHSPGDASYNANASSLLPQSFKELGSGRKPFPVRKRMFGRAWPYKVTLKDGIAPSWPELMKGVSVPCTDDVIATLWLNNHEVREAIHAHEDSGEWSLCANLGYLRNAGSMIDYHRNISSSGYRVLIFSGDHDMCVPFTGTQAWTESMGYEVVEEWRPWMYGGQVAGFLQHYANDFTFLTIKGAGHTVPEYKPAESLEFFRKWLNGDKI